VYAKSVKRGRGIDWTDTEKLRKELADLRTPEGERLMKRKADFITGISAQIDKSNPLMGKIDASGKQQVYEFSYFVDQKIDEYKKAGKNPHDLFDPSKPDYMGAPQTLTGFQKTMQESMKDFADQMRRSSVPTEESNAPRKPGESVADYLKRTGK
jgi:hypothetical protein